MTEHHWMHDIVHTDGTPPPELDWTCPRCGPQPPLKLSGNRFLRRRCACVRERQAHEDGSTQAARQRQQRDAAGQQQLERQRQQQAQAVGRHSRQARPLTPLRAVLSPKTVPETPPPPELFWECPTCGVIAPLALPSGRWLRRSCACQRREREAQARAQWFATWQQEQAERTFGGWLGAEKVDHAIVQQMAAKTFDTFRALRQPDAFEKALAFARKPKGNLLLSGPCGTGKTHLEAAICNYRREAATFTSEEDLRPYTSLFLSAPQLFERWQQTRRAFDQTAHLRFTASLTSSPLLVLDDIAQRTPQKEDWEIYWFILDARCTANRATILSINRREELSRFLGEASLSRLNRGLIPLTLTGDDYRQEERPT